MGQYFLYLKLSYRANECDRMPCELCGHLNKSHKKMTSTIYYCGDCKIVESHASFKDEKGEPIERIDSSIKSTSLKDLMWEVHRR